MVLAKDAKILIIDDSAAILALLRDLLKHHGYTNVTTVDSVDAGLEHYKKAKPDIVFLDLMLPETSGIEFTKDALDAHGDARIVVTTALPPTHQAVLMAISHGATEYLQKPLRPDALEQVLNNVGGPQRADGFSYA